MPKNVGSIDRVIRILLAVLFVVLIVAGTVSGAWAILLGILAAVFAATALIGFCPIYALLKLSTNPNK